MRFLKSINAILLVVEKSLVVLLLSVMVVLAFFQVVLRNFFSGGFLWADPFLRHLVLWIGFLGASLATHQEKHINLDILTRFLKPRWVIGFHVITNLFAGGVCYFLARAGWVFLQSEIATEGSLFSIGTIEVQTWWLETIIPFGFALIAFRFLLKSAEHIFRVIRYHEPDTPTLNVPMPGT